MHKGRKSNSLIMLGVLPPPVHGQSLATKILFETEFEGVQKIALGMNSSQSIDEVGKFSFKKVLGLIPVLCKTIYWKYQSNATVLYYTAGSADYVPFYRDVILLSFLRPFFLKTLIHYHSGGLPEFLRNSRLRLMIANHIYGREAWAISLSQYTQVPGIEFGAEKVIEIPNGIADPMNKMARKLGAAKKDTFNIIFIGNFYEDKGIYDVVDSVKIASLKTNRKIGLQLVGSFPSVSIKLKLLEELSHLNDNVQYIEPGPLYGNAKWKALAEADIFVFPSYYKSENLPIVVMEAMAMGLPIVSYRWRGLSSLVRDGENGILIPVRNVKMMADAIVRLEQDDAERRKMGERSRERYLGAYTDKIHLKKMRKTLLEILG